MQAGGRARRGPAGAAEPTLLAAALQQPATACARPHCPALLHPPARQVTTIEEATDQFPRADVFINFASYRS